MSIKSNTENYRSIWSKELKFKVWDQILYREEDMAYGTSYKITIMDIAANGDMSEWSINLPAMKSELEGWIRVNRDLLEESSCDWKLRLIVFQQSIRYFAQELIGLHYEIEPAFFRDIASSKTRADPTIDGIFKGGLWPAYDEQLPDHLFESSPDQLDFGNGWNAKLTGCKQKDSQEMRHIVVVSAPLKQTSSAIAASLDRHRFTAFVDGLDDTIGQTGERVYDFQHSWWAKHDIDFARVFVTGIKNRESNFIADMIENPLMCLLPVLEIQLIISRGILGISIRKFRAVRKQWSNQYVHQILETAWNDLRMLKDDIDHPFWCFETYDSHMNQPTVLASPLCSSLFLQLERVKTQVDRTEQLLRDYFQVYIGQLSLDESRASIKQSKLALEESRRTKLINVLAVLFVPISIGTSIFGMNLQELNESGVSLSVFVYTTVVILVVATTIWAGLYQNHIYRSLIWRDFKEDVLWYVRLHQFLRLLCHGHFVWAWKSGIAFSLLTNGRLSFQLSCDQHKDEYSPDSVLTTNATVAYFRKHVGSGLRDHPHFPTSYIMMHLALREGFETSNFEINI